MKTVRELAIQPLIADFPCSQIMGDRYVQQGALDVQKVRPFTVVKLGFNAELNKWRRGPRQTSIELWVNDDPGDYSRIDAFINEAVRVYMDLQSSPEHELIESRHLSTSQDFEDIDLGTILKVATFQWTLAPLRSE